MPVAVAVDALIVMGWTIVLVYPDFGPSAWLRATVRKIIARIIGKPDARTMLDCYICSAVWLGLLYAFLSTPDADTIGRLWRGVQIGGLCAAGFWLAQSFAPSFNRR